MRSVRLQSDWPTRRVELAVDSVKLTLCVPDNPYGLLDQAQVEQAFKEDEYMPYWAHLWPAGMMLGQWLARQVADPQPGGPAPRPPARLLEIGCGLGVAGLIAARLGYQATLTDYDPDAVECARRNAQLNGLRVEAGLLDWRRPPGQRYPFILGADVLYEQRNHHPILEFLRMSLSPPGRGGDSPVESGLAALADPGRRVTDAFLRDAPVAGWSVRVEPCQWENVQGRIILLQVKSPELQ